jgi:hypothetical protein
VTLPKLVKDTGAGLLVTDYSPMRLGREWRDKVGGRRGGLCRGLEEFRGAGQAAAAAAARLSRAKESLRAQRA